MLNVIPIHFINLGFDQFRILFILLCLIQFYFSSFTFFSWKCGLFPSFFHSIMHVTINIPLCTTLTTLH